MRVERETPLGATLGQVGGDVGRSEKRRKKDPGEAALKVARALAKTHGGEIRIEVGPDGRGTCVEVVLPIAVRG
jgi:hypothetical protein